MEFFSLSSILLLFLLSFANPILSLSDQPLVSSLELHGEESCPYTVIVTTSCFSPDWSRDQITIALGDSDGNKVVASRLDKPLSGAGGFEKCSSDTFQVKGQCLNAICSVYIYRSGPDGWIPKTIEVYEEGSKSVKFDFNKNIPENVWYGHNNCNNTGLPPPSPDFPPFSPTVPPPQPDFPPFSPTVPPPQPPYFPPDVPSIPPPPPHPTPSAAFGRGSGESLVVAFAAIVFAFVVV
ncbi:hypothetical protein AALP_AA8G452700 [Arabis alpina]|uniref:Embryo-specific protein 3 n=1 Tax=Arabis alpina TaxID=50452 RepID=A0A087GDK1_ARAAL|nr:hypothetical protein AALP_AA8G452700 [Arabis alpina]